jgi:metal-responsive CopG/Arc/MetJ family transcriptional regulator
MTEKTENFSISLPADLRRQLKERAAKEARPVSNLIRVAIIHYLELLESREVSNDNKTPAL